MTLTITRDFAGNYELKQVVITELPPQQIEMMRRSGQDDPGKRQLLKPVMDERGIPIRYGPDGGEQIKRVMEDIVRREIAAGREARFGQIDRGIPCF